ncbi:MAG TPA: helix-turn-helix transcriptional regulator [Pseudoxanthomonas sp.]|nr:helix-turn-helix transcriptional regulator [Pseudoxanthomonas sp.]
MASDVKLDTRLIRKLREDKGWSQEHLAAVSGLSVRTIQRLEAEGNASLESRSAITLALGVEPLALDEAMRSPVVELPPTLTVDVIKARPAIDLFKVAQLIALVVGLMIAMGYVVGRDLAKRDNQINASCKANPADCRR